MISILILPANDMQWACPATTIENVSVGVMYEHIVRTIKQSFA